MKTNEILKNILKFSFPTVVSTFVALIVLPLVSRVYPEAEYGYISNFYSVGTMLMGIVFLGLDNAYIRFFDDPPDIGTNRSGMSRFVFSVGLTVTISMFVVAFLIAPRKISILLFNDQKILGIILLGIYVMSLCIYRMCNINFRFSNNIKAFNFQQIAYILGNRLLFALAIFYSTRYIFSVAVMTICTLAMALVSLIYQPSAFKDGIIDSKARGIMIRFSLPLIPTTIIVQLNNSIAKLILGGQGLRDAVGVMAIATSAANIFSVIPNAIAVYWGPFMYQYYNTEQKKIKRAHDIIMMISLILVIGVIAFQDVIYLVLGAAYRSSQPYFMLIMLTPITLLLGETTTYGINLANKTKYALIATLIGSISNALACFILIPKIGEYGAAIGVGLSATLTFAIKTLFAQRYYSSICNINRSLCGCALIWGLCIGNLWLSGQIVIRIAICIISIGICAGLYREVIKSIWLSAISIIKHKQ